MTSKKAMDTFSNLIYTFTSISATSLSYYADRFIVDNIKVEDTIKNVYTKRLPKSQIESKKRYPT